MNVYIYRADLYCEDCGDAIKASLIAEGKAPANPSDEASYDSDDFPKGPFPDGGGEADSPCHCANDDQCLNAIDTGTPYPGGWGKVGVMLENPLTVDGQEYVREAMFEADRNPVSKMWADYYGGRYGLLESKE